MSAHEDYGPKELDLEVPSAARAYDYLLGGSHNFKIDRDFANQVREHSPWTPNVTRLNRSFLGRVVRFCLDQGITQFLDLGSGIPTVGNVHEVAQQRVPDARVVYVDYEPVAYQHASAMLADNPNATIIQADIRDPEFILNHPETRELLDFSRPLGLLIVGVLLFIGPEDQPAELVRAYRERLAPGSYLAISHITGEHASPELQAQLAATVAAYREANEQLVIRDHAEISSWFAGMELVEPGVTFLPDWRPDTPDEAQDLARPLGYGGVARQP
ncbi:SAM-dependent methyltransferase [Natronosporangium hydrolyticum]|uniref:SAM-dependent methyltransferase n=1 Tax=Natronosporangium hydrolyticum TaxID=2811111 RepID=A0A895YGW1_9ACTN|nr:SAM-dependent methyltransferase [Natronosporangium hydrolyticum]QSB14633.1 SAM-dependent methyltransferase [Natronosporangium hydrolyticum]